jgi:hypothetical protein
MTVDAANTQPISIQEALMSSMGSAEMVRRLEAAEIVHASDRRSGTAARRLTYEAPVNQRTLVLTATCVLMITVALQAFGVAALL